MKSLFTSLLASGLVGAHAYGQSLYTLTGSPCTRLPVL